MRRPGGAFVLGLGVTAAALAFGSRPLAVAGLGLLLAGGLARVWAGLVRDEVELGARPDPGKALEGDRVRVVVDVRRRSRVPVGSASLRLDLGKLGSHELRLHGRGRELRGVLDLGALARGTFAVSSARVVLGDHLGLASVTLPGRSDYAAVVVHPRLVALRGLFSEGGVAGEAERRLLLRRAAGFDFHSVRDYEQGESLRRVHWPTSARRGRLMVKELQDAPHDDVVVVLDCDPAGAAGAQPDSSFDAAVRAAGSIVRAHARRGRTTTLVTTARAPATVSVRSGGAGFDPVLAVLAAVEPDAPHALGRSLRANEPVVRSGTEVVVVTAAPTTAVAPALLRIAGHRRVSVAWIDAPSFAGRPTRADPGLLRLAGSGIPVAVVRRGDDLAVALGASTTKELARA